MCNGRLGQSCGNVKSLGEGILNGNLPAFVLHRRSFDTASIYMLSGGNFMLVDFCEIKMATPSLAFDSWIYIVGNI